MVQTDPDFPDQPMDGGQDHWVDSVLYACAFASYGRAGISGRAKQKSRIDDDDEPLRRSANRGRTGYGERY